MALLLHEIPVFLGIAFSAGNLLNIVMIFARFGVRLLVDVVFRSQLPLSLPCIVLTETAINVSSNPILY
jgi:hypothetical protein